VSVDGLTGITVPPRDHAALSRAITVLLENAELRSGYGAAALRRVREEFTARRMGSRTLDLYCEVLSLTGRPIAADNVASVS
jgi:rhamnosyl/mannosyltransferase